MSVPMLHKISLLACLNDNYTNICTNANQLLYCLHRSLLYDMEKLISYMNQLIEHHHNNNSRVQFLLGFFYYLLITMHTSSLVANRICILI